MLKRTSKPIYIICLIVLISSAMYFGKKNTVVSPVFPILHEMQSRLKSGENVRLSGMGDFDRICVFLQDDSDEGFARQDMDKFLLAEKINLDFKNHEEENPENILLFIKGNNAIAVYDWEFIAKNQQGSLHFEDYEEKRNLCLPWSKAVISNNLYLTEFEVKL